jgi:hypothetical protein
MDPDSMTCFEPVFHGGLDNFHHYHPTGTLMMTVRRVDDWLASIIKYVGLGNRFRNTCKGPGYFATHWANKNVTNDDLVKFYNDHLQAVRDFAAAHPSLTYIELSLESNETGAILESLTGITSECWGDRNNFEIVTSPEEIQKRKMRTRTREERELAKQNNKQS